MNLAKTVHGFISLFYLAVPLIYLVSFTLCSIHIFFLYFFPSVSALQNVRVGKCVEIHLDSRDRNNSRLQRGGEIITAELRYKDVNTIRSLNVNVEDLRDGTYKLSFVPDTPGKLMLSIYVKGQQIKVCTTYQMINEIININESLV